MQTKGKHRSGEDKAVPSMNFVIAGICSLGLISTTATAEHGDCAKFQKRAEVIARREQHPDRQNRRGESINHDRPSQPFLVLTKPSFNCREVAEKLSAPHAECQADQAENRDCENTHFSRAQRDTHDQREGNRHSNRENAPRTFRQRLHHDQRKNREQNNHDGEHANESEQTHAASDFFLHHLAQRFSAAPDRGEQNDHVVHAAAESGADQDPKSTGQKTKLRSQHGADQGSGSGNGGEMMTENHPAIRWHIILVVISQNSRRGALLIQNEHFGREPFAVKAIADR